MRATATIIISLKDCIHLSISLIIPGVYARYELNVYSTYKHEGCMQVKVKKWGNSLGLRIPKNVAEELRLGEDQVVELTTCNGRLVVASRPTLQELVDRITPEKMNRAKDFDHPVGNEAW